MWCCVCVSLRKHQLASVIERSLSPEVPSYFSPSPLFFLLTKSNKQTNQCGKFNAGFSASDETPADKLSMVE